MSAKLHRSLAADEGPTAAQAGVARLVPAERRLLERARGGDVAAFESLYRDHVGRVYALCLRLSGDVTRAEETAQDVFVRAWQKLASFRGESAFSSWLYRLALNLFFSAERTRRRRAGWLTGSAGEAALEEPAPPAAPPGARLDLERAVAALPTQARTVFVLHDVMGYRHAEIAAQTGLAVGTSKAHLHRARRLLREVLER